MDDTQSGGPGPTSVRLRVAYIHHVSFRVDDLDDSIAFYCDVLGCSLIPRPDLGFRGAWVQVGDLQIHLLEGRVDEGTGTPPNWANPFANHVAFHVDDLTAFEAHLRAHGHEPTPGVPQLPQLFLRDPSGNTVEFTTSAK